MREGMVVNKRIDLALTRRGGLLRTFLLSSFSMLMKSLGDMLSLSGALEVASIPTALP